MPPCPTLASFQSATACGQTCEKFRLRVPLERSLKVCGKQRPRAAPRQLGLLTCKEWTGPLDLRTEERAVKLGLCHPAANYSGGAPPSHASVQVRHSLDTDFQPCSGHGGSHGTQPPLSQTPQSFCCKVWSALYLLCLTRLCV